MSSYNQGLAEAIDRVAGLASFGKTVPHPAGGVALVIPEGYRAEHLKHLYTPDPHIIAAPTFAEVGSFVTYVNKFKGDEPIQIFADRAGARVSAVLDYHQPGENGVRPLKHVAALKLAHSSEWDAWSGINGGPQPQVKFAEFIEEHIIDILEPASAELLELVTNFQSNTNVTFQSKVTLQSGYINLSFQEIGEATGGVSKTKVPQRLKLALAVYEGEPRDEITALLRHRVSEGKLSFIVKLDYFVKAGDGKVVDIRRRAFSEICERIGAETSTPVLVGALTNSRY
jgi:uncharacterized protein YfdQ (DUF2303 family)